MVRENQTMVVGEERERKREERRYPDSGKGMAFFGRQSVPFHHFLREQRIIRSTSSACRTGICDSASPIFKPRLTTSLDVLCLPKLRIRGKWRRRGWRNHLNGLKLGRGNSTKNTEETKSFDSDRFDRLRFDGGEKERKEIGIVFEGREV